MIFLELCSIPGGQYRIAMTSSILERKFLRTFQDVLISCHHAVLIIMASRDYAPDHLACFQNLGRDCYEEHFSSNGSLIFNKHKYTITETFRNRANMNGLRDIFSDQHVPKNQKDTEKTKRLGRVQRKH